MGADVVADSLSGTTPTHLLGELAATALALTGVAHLWRRMEAARRTVASLGYDLKAAREEAERWRSEAGALLLGLGVAIDRQFDRWGLTSAEREIALLLLKG
ncbi:MAG TPA: LuxR family transcriptional regulator, partial [Vicinamibacteria bacterium]|nr:LuxR family transcriptional regulator [Vicinamibacteria bacterium]